MYTVLDRQVRYRTLRHDFDNDWAYLEQFENDRFVGCFFTKKGNLFPDGTPKSKMSVYYYIPLVGVDEITLNDVDWTKVKFNRLGNDIESFDYFDKLYSYAEVADAV